MEITIQAAAICVLAAVLALVVRRGDSALAILISLGAAVTVLLLLSGVLSEIAEFLWTLSEQTGVGGALFVPLYKTAGIALVVKIGGDLCRDAGETALTSVLETIGTVCALVVALPMLRTAFGLLMELMGT